VATTRNSYAHAPARRHARTRISSRQQSELTAAVGTQVYRELHGVLGEGRGQYEQGMHVLLCIINANNATNILDRLKVPVWRCVALCGVGELMTQVFLKAAAQARHAHGPVPLLHWAGGVRRGLIRHALGGDPRCKPLYLSPQQ
jgi:hypothetical protein